MTRHFPATFVKLPPNTEGRRAAFYLAAEEYIAKQMPIGSYFMTWQTGRTVVIGRNQVAQQELNLDFCRDNGIDIIRRRSGGGAIFADEGNIMTSLITEAGPVELLFHEYAETVAEALRALGAPAQVAGRNDIVLHGEKKVCGNAFYHRNDHCITHGTMLYDTNPELMEGALNPDTTKLQQRGVKSVRSRVGTLKEYLPFDASELRRKLKLLLCNRTVQLTADDIQQVEQLEQRYYEPDFMLLSPTLSEGDIVRKGRIPGCGQIELRFHIRNNRIQSVGLRGDFFATADVDKAFEEAFVGALYNSGSILQAIESHHPERSIRGLESKELSELIHGEL